MPTKKKKKYKVLTYTICEGWVDCWHDECEPLRFDSIAEANAEIQELVNDMPDYDARDYMVVEEGVDETKIKDIP